MDEEEKDFLEIAQRYKPKIVDQSSKDSIEDIPGHFSEDLFEFQPTSTIFINNSHIIILKLHFLSDYQILEHLHLLSNLKTLNLSYNNLDYFPTAIYRLFELTDLILAHNRLQELPNDIHKLISIESLDLSDNSISTLPLNFNKLRYLKMLNLSHNPITEFPSYVDLSKISQLFLNNTEIQEIPRQFFLRYKTSALQQPFLQDLEIPIQEKEFLAELGLLLKSELPILEQIHKDDYGLSIRNGHIVRLGLNHQNLYHIPPTLEDLTQLEFLALGNNHILKLPEGIKNLRQLHTLYLNDNQLEEIPWVVGDLLSLRKLRLDGNKLEILPENIANLKNLRELYLDRNRFSQLYAIKDIAQLPNLDKLSCMINPWDHLSAPIVRNGLEAIRDDCNHWCGFIAYIDEKIRNNECLDQRDYSFPNFNQYLAHFEELCRFNSNRASQELQNYLKEAGCVDTESDFKILL